MQRTFGRIGTAVVGIVLMIASSVAMASSWTLDGSGVWNDSGNWSGGVPNSTGALAVFGNGFGSTTLSRTINLASGTVTAGAIEFNSTSGAAYDISGGTVHLQGSIGGAGIAMAPSTAADQTITAALVVQANQPLQILNDAAGRSIFIGGPLTATGSSTVSVTGNGTVSIGSAGIGTGITSLSRTSGTGTLILTGSNSYGGETLIGAGTLRLAGAASTGAGPTTVSGSGSRLAGDGTITAGLSMGVNTAVFSPLGSGSAETLTVAGNTSLAASTSLDLEIFSAASFDRLLVTAGSGPGTELGGAILNLAVGYSPTIGSSFPIIDMQGTAFLAGSQFLRLPDQTTLFNNDEFVSGGTTLRINYDVSPGGGVTLTVVPEPSCLVLVGIGAVALGGWRRRR
jgi:autotransporter-associated beta strand protein